VVSAMTTRTALAVPIAVILLCTLPHPRGLSQTRIEPREPWSLCCRDTSQTRIEPREPWSSFRRDAPGGLGPPVNSYRNPAGLGNVCYTEFGGYLNPTYLGVGAPCSVDINGTIYPGFTGVAGPLPQ
jgi:hypothetical protein